MNVKKFNDFILNESKIDTSDFEYISFLGGSTGADLYKDSKGKKWVVKKGSHINQMWNEYVSNKIYSKFGIHVPDAYIGVIDGEKSFVMEYLEDSVPLGEVDLSTVDVDKGFILDVLTANWDVVGTTFNLDNIRVKDGKAYRVDLGGSLFYRAQGAEKGRFFNEIPTEHETLRNKKMNYKTFKVFSKIDDDYIKDNIREILKNYLVDGKINHKLFFKHLYEIIFDEDNDMDIDQKRNLYKLLGKRAVNLYNMFID